MGTCIFLTEGYAFSFIGTCIYFCTNKHFLSCQHKITVTGTHIFIYRNMHFLLSLKTWTSMEQFLFAQILSAYFRVLLQQSVHTVNKYILIPPMHLLISSISDLMAFETPPTCTNNSVCDTVHPRSICDYGTVNFTDPNGVTARKEVLMCKCDNGYTKNETDESCCK